MPLVEGYNKLKSKAEQIVESVKTSKLLSQKKDAPLPYAYPCDNYMDSILSNGLVRKSLQLFADKYCKEQIQKIKSTGQLVSKANYPHFYNILQSCYKSLNIEEEPEVYATNQLKGINALSLGTDKAPILLISPKAIVLLDEEELKFMIGHELGHILQKNLMCHTIKGMLDRFKSRNEVLGLAVADLIEVPLNEWYQCAEYTADRAGYLCCRNMDAVRSLFRKIYERKARSNYQDWLELYQDHPYLKTREEILNSYIQTLQQE